MNKDFLNWKRLMISIIIWIATWGVFEGLLLPFKLSRERYALVCLVILIGMTIYVSYNPDINWKDF